MNVAYLNVTFFFLAAGFLMSFHGHSCPSIMIICVQPQTWGVSVGGAVMGMTHHVFLLFLFFYFLANAMVPSRDLVPYANSILCILVSLILHRPDRKGTLALDLKGAEAWAPPLCMPLSWNIFIFNLKNNKGYTLSKGGTTACHWGLQGTTFYLKHP